MPLRVCTSDTQSLSFCFGNRAVKRRVKERLNLLGQQFLYFEQSKSEITQEIPIILLQNVEILRGH